MKILYDHQIFTGQKYGGISRYFCELYSHLSQLHDIEPEISVFYTDNDFYQRLFPNKRIIPDKKFPGKTTGINFLNLWNSKIHLMKSNFDLFHPTYYNPYFLDYLKEKPFVLTIYDMIHELFSEYFSPEDPTIRYKKRLVEMAACIITITQSTRNDIIRYFNIDEKRVNVIYLGNSLKATKEPSNLVLPPQYVLFVGDRHIYKNFNRFIVAIAPILLSNPSLYLVCAGGNAFSHEEISLLTKLGILPKVLQYPITDDILYHLYKNAICFVFPSLYEGFGIPILESFSSGCPVVLSNGGSLPEIGGDAAIYFDPYDEESIRNSIEYVIADESLRKRMQEKGYERVKDFSWTKTAQQTADVYRKLMNSR
mgnify:CR=1 FL=1